MRVLVSGHDGYIGRALVPLLLQGGHDVVGLDTYLYEGCTLGVDDPPIPAIRLDIRDVTADDLRGFEAVIHLAAISNDPLGDLRPAITSGINHRGTVHLARMAKDAGVTRFLFSSSCSLYGAQGDGFLDENASWNPVTPYGESKLRAEQDLRLLADDAFSPTYLRNATAYGVSSRLRGDLVVNNLVAYAYTTGRVLLKSDGTPWRPLVHIQDIARAFIAIMEAPRELVHNEAFNVGRTSENYQIRQVAEIVESVVPGSSIAFASTAGPDRRNYRVACDRIALILPNFQPSWTVRQGAEELLSAFKADGLTVEELEGARYQRIRRVQELLAAGRLDEDLRWRHLAPPASRPGHGERPSVATRGEAGTVIEMEGQGS